MKLLLSIFLIISIFTVNVNAFEGLHQRSGIFYIAHENRPATLIKSNYLNVVWESGIVKYFTKNDGGKLRIKKNQNNSGYQEIQIIPIEEQEIILNIPCEIHSYPMEFKEYKTGEILQPGTYKVNQFSVGWLGVINEDGSISWIHPNRNEKYEYLGGKNAYFKNGKNTLSVNQVNGVLISTNYLLTATNHAVRPAYASLPQYVTIHNTDSTSKGANALAHAKIQYGRQNDKTIWSSWHFQVDDHSIYQSIPMDEVAWHAGDGSMQGNTTVGIEICENSDGNYALAEKNAAYLTAQILFELGLPKDAIRMHRDWNGKTCPRNIINGTKGSMGWSEFKNTVARYYDQLVEESKPEEIVDIDEEFVKMAQDIGYTTDKNILYRIPTNTTMNQLANQIKAYDDSASITFMDADNVVLNEGILKTGYKMKVVITENKEQPEIPVEPELPEPGEPEITEDLELQIESNDISEPVIKECTFILSAIGDANGDGKISSIDYVLVKNHILNMRTLKGSKAISSDVNFDKKISSIDYVMIKNHILEITKIK